MTYKEILEREEDNWNTVYLYHEGMFLKAYNHSACLIHLFVHDFKVSKRFIKSVNQDVFSLGFPKDYSKKWLNARPFNQIGDKEFKYDIGKSIDEIQYHNWTESVLVNAGDRYTPHTSVIEKAPVYKVAYDLMIDSFKVSANFSRGVQDTLGNRLKLLTYELCYLIRTMYDVEHKERNLDEALVKCSEIKYLIQVLKDLKEVSINTFALASERIVSVSKQLDGLRRKVTAE